MSDGGAVPHIRSTEFAFPRTIDALFTPIGDGGKDFLLGEYCGDLLRSIAIQSHSEYAADHLGGLLIHDPPFGIVGVFLVAIGRRPHRFAGVALDLVADPALLANVVRYAVGSNKGQIVKHLKPVDLKATEQAQGLSVKALQFVQKGSRNCCCWSSCSWRWSMGIYQVEEPRTEGAYRIPHSAENIY